MNTDNKSHIGELSKGHPPNCNCIACCISIGEKNEKEEFVIRKRTPKELQEVMMFKIALHEVLIKTLEKKIKKLENEKKEKIITNESKSNCNMFIGDFKEEMDKVIEKLVKRFEL